MNLCYAGCIQASSDGYCFFQYSMHYLSLKPPSIQPGRHELFQSLSKIQAHINCFINSLSAEPYWENIGCYGIIIGSFGVYNCPIKIKYNKSYHGPYFFMASLLCLSTNLLINSE